MSESVVLATRNTGKVAELAAILADVLTECGLRVLPVDVFPELADVVETGVTFRQNAELKARTVAQATGLPALADDSGLAVAVLGGSPGVFSARWAGRHGDDRANLELLLAQLADVADEHRAAAFVCCAALALPDGRLACREGRLAGRLAREPRGSGGFGYDPVLLVDGDARGRTAAQLDPQEKNQISHRAQAFTALGADIRALLG